MRHKQTGMYVCLFLLVCFFCFPVGQASAKSLNDVEKERKEVKEKLSDAEKKIADIVIEIDELEQEMHELEDIMEANEKEMKKTEKDIEKVQKEIDELKRKIEERFDILKERAKSYQESGGNASFLDVLFDAETFNEFISRVSAISKITDADAELIEEQKRDKRKVEAKKASLEEMKEELEAKQEQLEDQKEEKQKANKKLKKKKSNLNKSVDKLEMKNDKLSDLETKLTKEKESGVSFADDNGDGEFGWPTEGGYVSSPMGKRWGKMHKGIDIARTDRSTSPPIYAAEKGTVSVAGQINGYGNAVIINHGNGKETLYGHMSELKVRSGQHVKRGQQIGVMGSTGHSTGIHLHFEVHDNGKLQNPIGYLNK